MSTIRQHPPSRLDTSCRARVVPCLAYPTGLQRISCNLLPFQLGITQLPRCAWVCVGRIGSITFRTAALRTLVILT
jgi:hypothetical protein